MTRFEVDGTGLEVDWNDLEADGTGFKVDWNDLEADGTGLEVEAGTGLEMDYWAGFKVDETGVEVDGTRTLHVTYIPLWNWMMQV